MRNCKTIELSLFIALFASTVGRADFNLDLSRRKASVIFEGTDVVSVEGLNHSKILRLGNSVCELNGEKTNDLRKNDVLKVSALSVVEKRIPRPGNRLTERTTALLHAYGIDLQMDKKCTNAWADKNMICSYLIVKDTTMKFDPPGTNAVKSAEERIADPGNPERPLVFYSGTNPLDLPKVILTWGIHNGMLAMSGFPQEKRDQLRQLENKLDLVIKEETINSVVVHAKLSGSFNSMDCEQPGLKPRDDLSMTAYLKNAGFRLNISDSIDVPSAIDILNSANRSEKGSRTDSKAVNLERKAKELAPTDSTGKIPAVNDAAGGGASAAH